MPGLKALIKRGAKIFPLLATFKSKAAQRHQSVAEDIPRDGIIFPNDLYEEFRDSIRRHMKLKLAEDDFDKTKSMLRARLRILEQKVEQIKEDIARLETEEVDAIDDVIDAKRQDLATLLSEREDIFEQRDAVKDYLSSKCYDFWSDISSLFDTWRGILGVELDDDEDLADRRGRGRIARAQLMDEEDTIGGYAQAQLLGCEAASSNRARPRQTIPDQQIQDRQSKNTIATVSRYSYDIESATKSSNPPNGTSTVATSTSQRTCRSLLPDTKPVFSEE